MTFGGGFGTAFPSPPFFFWRPRVLVPKLGVSARASALFFPCLQRLVMSPLWAWSLWHSPTLLLLKLLFPPLLAILGRDMSNQLVGCSLIRAPLCFHQNLKKTNKLKPTFLFFSFSGFFSFLFVFLLFLTKLKTIYNTRVASRKRFVYGQSPTLLWKSWRILLGLRPLLHFFIKCLPIKGGSSPTCSIWPHYNKPLSLLRVTNHDSS